MISAASKILSPQICGFGRGASGNARSQLHSLTPNRILLLETTSPARPPPPSRVTPSIATPTVFWSLPAGKRRLFCSSSDTVVDARSRAPSYSYSLCDLYLKQLYLLVCTANFRRRSPSRVCCVCVCVSVCLSLSVSVGLSLSVCLPACLSVYLSSP